MTNDGSTTALLSKFTTEGDEMMDEMQTKSIVENSPLIINGTLAIVGNVGSGKTTLLAKMALAYREEINPDIFYFHNSVMDSTMANYISEHKIDVTVVTVDAMDAFISDYRRLKQLAIEFYKYITTDSYWSDYLEDVKKTLKVKSLLPSAKTFLMKHKQPFTIKVGNKDYNVKPLINEDGKITKSLMLFDDITQFKNFTGKYANNFFKELAANTRHFANTSIFSMQRFTYLQKDVRVLVHSWFLGYGITDDDIKSLFSQTISIGGYSKNDLVKEYAKINRYEFLAINSGMEIIETVKLSR